MHLLRITRSTHPLSQLRAQHERKAVPYCCKPLPDMKGSVVVRFPTHLCPLGLFFLVGARKSKKLWAQEVPPDLAQRAPVVRIGESEIPRTKAGVTAKPSRRSSRSTSTTKSASFTILVFHCRDQVDCRGHLRREPSVFRARLVSPARLRKSYSISTARSA
jgi:hypothetical protein